MARACNEDTLAGARVVAVPTGLEPAASAVTGRRANQLRYGTRTGVSIVEEVVPHHFETEFAQDLWIARWLTVPVRIHILRTGGCRCEDLWPEAGGSSNGCGIAGAGLVDGLRWKLVSA